MRTTAIVSETFHQTNQQERTRSPIVTGATHVCPGETENTALNHRPVVDVGIALLRPEAFHGAHDWGAELLDALREDPANVGVTGEKVLHLDEAARPSFAIQFEHCLPGTTATGSGGASTMVRDGGASRVAECGIEFVGQNLWARSHSHGIGFGGGV